jgi:hypothetical protein
MTATSEIQLCPLWMNFTSVFHPLTVGSNNRRMCGPVVVFSALKMEFRITELLITNSGISIRISTLIGILPHARHFLA